MKKNATRFFLTLITVSLLAVACSSNKAVVTAPRKVPPGQAKKMTGSQSAKPYAPGQQKKKH